MPNPSDVLPAQAHPFDRRTFVKGAGAVAVGAGLSRYSAVAAPVLPKSPQWSVDVTVLESCGCRVFCQCFFNGMPMGADPSSQVHPCLFNQAYQVDRGHYGDVDLAGARFWYSGNAGADLNQHVWPWAVMTFDSGLSERQKQALARILQTLRFYRDEHWRFHSFAPAAPIQWSAERDIARASVDRGKVAEVSLKAFKDANDKPVMIMNMGYFGWPRNNGFALMPAELEAYRVPGRSFEFKGTNGLKTTLSMNSSDVDPRTGRVT